MSRRLRRTASFSQFDELATSGRVEAPFSGARSCVSASAYIPERAGPADPARHARTVGRAVVRICVGLPGVRVANLLASWRGDPHGCRTLA